MGGVKRRNFWVGEGREEGCSGPGGGLGLWRRPPLHSNPCMETESPTLSYSFQSEHLNQIALLDRLGLNTR